MQEGDWSPDDIALTVEAFHLIREGADETTTIAALAAELDRDASAVRAAVRAVGAGPSRSKILRMLVGEAGAPNLHDDRSFSRSTAKTIRSLRAARNP